MTDRYIKIVLTVIALELFWIGLRDVATPVSAQAPPPLTPVVIRGIEVGPNTMLPVSIDHAVTVRVDRALPITAEAPLPVAFDGPVEVTASQPLPVRQVPYVPSERPGE
jgi:hypothetical protein